ncbi:MAG TPA: MFS transporter [Dehalococcoidia bacterium]|nr:MFS transporter [Dehalococcoidia bacterium]
MAVTAGPESRDESSPAPTQETRGGLSLQTFVAFKSRPFRLLWFNQLSFVLSQSIRQFAFVWLVLEMDGGGQTLGLVAFALGFPILIFGLPAGALADRLDRRLLLFGSQIAALVITALAALLVWMDAMPLAATFVLAFLLGTSMAFGAPVRQAIVPSLVEPDRLLNAVTLIGMGQNVSQIIGPALGGLMIALFGIGAAFAFQATLLALGLIALVPLRVPPPTGAKRNMRLELQEGLSFVVHHPGIRALFISLIAVAVVMAGAFTTLLPKLAKDELGADAFGASVLFGAMGVGMLVSSLILASMSKLERAGLAFNMTLLVGTIFNVGTGLSPWYDFTFALMFLTGANAGFFTNLNLTLVQGHTPHAVMGRVMSIYTICMAGGMPLGALVAGFGADLFGTREWYTACGLGLGILALMILIWQPALRNMRGTLKQEEKAAARAGDDDDPPSPPAPTAEHDRVPV